MAYNTVKEIKLCLLGDSGVGKSCLALRYVEDRFELNTTITIGGAYLTKTFEKNHQCFKFNIWDTAGHERYKSLAPLYYRGAAAAIIVYDITSGSTFEGVKRWVKELWQKGSEDLVIAIAGNKKDLIENRKVSTETGQRYADEIKAFFFECSALTGENVEELFAGISQNLSPESPSFQHRGVPLKSVQETKKKCCLGR